MALRPLQLCLALPLLCLLPSIQSSPHPFLPSSVGNITFQDSRGKSDVAAHQERSTIIGIPVNFHHNQDGTPWLLGFVFTGDGTVVVVDRTPKVTYEARPALFGARLDEPLLGYVIPLSAFTHACPTTRPILRPFTTPIPPLSTPISSATEDGAIIEDEGDIDRGTVASPNDENLGCAPLCVSGPRKPDSSEKWIALVQRGECSFAEKVREAQRLGAAGVIVGGQTEELVNMYSPEESADVEIPATYIRKSSYVDLLEQIRQSNATISGLRTLSVVLTAEYSAWEWPLLTFALLLLLPSALTLTTLLVHRIRVARARARERAPVDIVSQLPWRVWGSEGWEKWANVPSRAEEGEGILPAPPPSGTGARGRVDVNTEPLVTAANEATPAETGVEEAEGETSHSSHLTSDPGLPTHEGETEQTQGSPVPPWFKNQTECAICLCDFELGDRVRILPCNHIFHMEEVDEWLVKRRKLCPVCKSDVTRKPGTSGPADGDGDIDSESDVRTEDGEPRVEAEQNQRQQTVPTERTPLLGGGSS